MNPLNHEVVARDRITEAMNRADRRRLVKAAAAGAMRSGLGSIRSVVGHGLIAMGERLVDPSSYRKAA